MKRILSTVLLLACVAIAQPAQAQTKIAVVDLKKVFDGYWRTKQADAQLKERAADFEKARNGLIEDYKKSNDEFRKANESINDPAVSQEERDRRKKDVEKRLQDVREQENSIRTFDQNTRQALGEQQARMRESVLKDIRGVLDEKSKAAGYNLVFDLAATTINQTTVIMYNNLAGTESDLTEVVLKQLNANAPADIKVQEVEPKKDDK
ncbi:MAG: OmpH family outer membrane protein [Verrucomicrobia bacterium]|nr:OmpH family outer membrane protein [Verrucomicrobiota bacterium]